MPVTQCYYRLDKAALDHYRDHSETFREEDYPDTESVCVYGDEYLLVQDLASRVTAVGPERELVSGAVSGFAGTSLYGNDDYPLLIDRRTVAAASRLLDDISPEAMRRACNLDWLIAVRREVEEWLWEEWGPNVFDKVLLPSFEIIRSLYHRAAERRQQVVVRWF